MKATLTLAISALALAACVPATPPPASAPAPTPAAAVRPAPAPVAQAPVSNSWIDMASTPGDWRYGARATGSEASFWSPAGAPMARLRCMADSRTVVLSLPESAARRPLVTIRTETATRTFEAALADREMIVALAPGDPLLDAMALSKGRFAVESEGLPMLLLPSWAEVTRVIEDCR
jgi:hypothetical protein